MLPQRPPLDWRRECLPIRQRYSEPNIQGSFTPIVSRRDATASGSISSFTSYAGANVLDGSGSCIDRGIQLNASKTSAIFGASDTVQPAGIYVQCLIRYA